MGRYRERSRSYSPRRISRTPPPPPRRGYDDRSYRDRRSPQPSGLLVRNIALDARPEDLRIPFERYGPIRDVYLPKNYYTREPRGFGFVKFRSAKDAAEAKHHLNHTVIGGREISIVFADENRKTPQDMRRTGRISGRYGGGSRRRSPSRSPRQRYRSYSRSPSPTRNESRSHRSRNYYSPSRSRSISRSLSPRGDKAYRSIHKSASPKINGRTSLDKVEHGTDQRPPILRNIDLSTRGDDHSPYDNGEPEFKRKSPSETRNEKYLSRSRSHSRSRSRSYSPR